MIFIPDVSTKVTVHPAATVSSTVLKAEGVRVVMFAFDDQQELTEHTAAMPILIEVVQGELTVTAEAETVTLSPGGVIHLGTRVPHAVKANGPAIMKLTMLDARKV